MAEAEPANVAASRTPRAYFEILSATLPMLAITVVTITANGAILAMFLSRRALRRCKNLYFVSLALADFLVGLSMPYKLTRDLHYNWDTGWSCRIYQTIKQSLAYASFLSIFLITVDKWRAMHYPVSYRNRSTKYTAIAAVVAVWLISFFIFSLPQLWWSHYLNRVTLKPSDNNLGQEFGYSQQENSSQHARDQTADQAPPGDTPRFCPEGYQLSLKLSIFSATCYYLLPVATMLVVDVALYMKIKWRKSVEVQRSTSVTDTYFMTLKKPALELSESCRSLAGDDDASKELLLKNSDARPFNKHLALGSRGERRHSSLPSISPILKGRTSSGRRVSMPESNAGGCRYVGRKWSGCASALTNNQPANPMANLAPRLHTEDMVRDILVKQDRRTTLCLCLTLGLLMVCWLPHAVVSILNAGCWCLFGAALTATSWLYQLDHALNPFLYGIMYVQFKNVLKQWLLVERVHAFKMRDTLILKNLQRKYEAEDNNKDKSPSAPTRFSHFDVSRMTSQTELTMEEADNTLL